MQTQAERIYEKFGGPGKLAKMLGYDRSTVYRWNYPVSKRGSGGLIPTKSLVKVIALAEEEGILIGAEDLFPNAKLVSLFD
jgi:amino-acid N-acetyltransferase